MGTCNHEHADFGGPFEIDPDVGSERVLRQRRGRGESARRPRLSDEPPLTKPSAAIAVMQALPMVIFLFLIALFVVAALVRSYR